MNVHTTCNTDTVTHTGFIFNDVTYNLPVTCNLYTCYLLLVTCNLSGEVSNGTEANAGPRQT